MQLQRLIGAAAGLLLCATSAAADEEAKVSDALFADDQCAAGDTACATNALQLRAKKMEAAANSSEGWYAACSLVGCNKAYTPGQNCQCNPDCMQHGNCCYDHSWICGVQSAKPSEPEEPEEPAVDAECVGELQTYSLDMEAAGATFFDQFTFVEVDDVHGAHQFTNQSEAERQKTITTDDGGAQMRFGGLRAPSFDGEAWKRYAANLHTNKAWDPEVGFVAALHYKSMPYGCGLWPSFWAMNSDKVWPGGGELDVLEFANLEDNKVTFHLGKPCNLDKPKVARCAPMHAQSVSANSAECETNYFVNKFGCMPKQRQPDGEYFASHPGVVAFQWTADHISVFHIPEDEIPKDLRSDEPKPETWQKWVIAYLPLESACKDVIGPQELVINMQLCGDWAGATFGRGKCHGVGSESTKPGCHAGLSQTIDCCTQYVTDPRQDSTMESQFWDIESIKVFTANGAKGQDSGTFKRGGVPLEAPAPQ